MCLLTMGKNAILHPCAGEAPARQCLVTRGLLPLLAEGSARATDSDTTDEILHAAIEYSKVGGHDHMSLQAMSAGL
jgi:pyruvate kinase